MRRLCLIFGVLASPLSASSYDRPIPQAQSATAEIWFALASIALFVALYGVYRIVKAR